MISDKLDQGEVLIHLLPPGWVQQRHRAKVEDTLGRGVDGTTGDLMIWGRGGQSGGEDGFQNTSFQTRMNRKLLDVSRPPSNRTASCYMILLFTTYTTHQTLVTVWSVCWLLCTFSCDTVQLSMSNVAHPDKEGNSPVMRQYMQSLYQPVLPAVWGKKKTLILSWQYCIIRAHERKSFPTLLLPLLQAPRMPHAPSSN